MSKKHHLFYFLKKISILFSVNTFQCLFWVLVWYVMMSCWATHRKNQKCNKELNHLHSKGLFLCFLRGQWIKSVKLHVLLFSSEISIQLLCLCRWPPTVRSIWWSHLLCLLLLKSTHTVITQFGVNYLHSWNFPWERCL